MINPLETDNLNVFFNYNTTATALNTFNKYDFVYDRLESKHLATLLLQLCYLERLCSIIQRGSFSVQLTSCFTRFDSAINVNLLIFSS